MSGALGQPRPQTDPFGLGVPAVPASLVTIRRALGAWLTTAGVTTEVAGALQVAVGEACANAVDHAHPPGRTGSVRVDVDRSGDVVTAVVRDDGGWRTPDRDPGDRGRGLLIMRQLLDDVTVDAGPTGTAVTLRVQAGALPPHATADADASGLDIDRSGDRPRVVAHAALDHEGDAAGLRLRLLEASRGGIVATDLDLAGAPQLAPGVASVIGEVAAIGRANGWTLRVLVADGAPGRTLLTGTGVELQLPWPGGAGCAPAGR